jgi:hypothetical protein
MGWECPMPVSFTLWTVQGEDYHQPKHEACKGEVIIPTL